MDAVSKKFIRKPLLKWKRPPQIALSPNWHVAAGEESEEAKTQKCRERKMPEAVYPCLSHIPPCSSPPLDVQEDYLDESRIPLIPITPIEEDQPPEGNGSSSLGGLKVLLPCSSHVSQNNACSHLNPSSMGKPTLEAGSSTQADVALAAATVATALMKSRESGSCIDTDLLVQILSDPKTVEKLISEIGAPGSRKTELVVQTKLPNTHMCLASSKPGKLEEACDGLGALKKSVDKSSPKPCTGPTKKNDENRAVVDKGNASFSTSDQVKCESSVFDRKVVPVPGANSASSQYTFVSQPYLGVYISTSLPTTLVGGPLALLPNSKPDVNEFKLTNCGYGVPTKTDVEHISGSNLFTPKATPIERSLVSLPNSKPDLDEFKWMNNGYGVPTRTNVEPIARPNLFTPEVTIARPNEDLVFPTSMNVYPLPSERQAHLLLKAVLSDAVRPTDSRLMSVSSDASKVNLYPSSNQLQTTLQVKTPFLNQVQAGLEITTPFPNQARPGLETSAPLPNQLELGLPMMGSTAVNVPKPFLLPSAGPQLQDKNYFKGLVQQHGRMREAQDYSLCFPQQDTKPMPYFNANNVQATKIQRPCFFFSRPEGCKHGYGCPYLHDQPQNFHLGSIIGENSSKKMKMDGEIFAIHR